MITEIGEGMAFIIYSSPHRPLHICVYAYRYCMENVRTIPNRHKIKLKYYMYIIIIL